MNGLGRTRGALAVTLAVLALRCSATADGDSNGGGTGGASPGSGGSTTSGAGGGAGANAGGATNTGGAGGTTVSSGGKSPIGDGGAQAGSGGTGAGGVGPASGGAGSGGDPNPPPEYTLRVDTPANGDHVTGTVTVQGFSPGFVNVEVWDAAHQNPPLGSAIPAADGSFTILVDVSSLPPGATTWTVHGWDVPAGGTPTHEDAVTLSLTVGGSGNVDAGAPGPTAFVMGAENKDGSQDQLSTALKCELNLLQRTTGWCNTWSGWEQNGCNVLSGVSSFYSASEKHGIELSLAPWPQSLSGQSFGACARGDYDSHYKALAQALVDAGVRHVTIRLAYEWDGSWFPWGTGLHETGSVNNAGPGGTALEYAACFKRFDADVQGVAKAAGTPVYFRMVMNPIHDTFGTKGTQLQQVFDAAGGARAAGGSVDVLGVDIYDYPSRNNFDSRMQASIAFAKKNGVPLSVPEWGVGGDSRSEPAVDDAGQIYIQKMAGYLGDPSNDIPYASYFNCAQAACAGLHSLIPPNNPKSNAAFVAAFGNDKLGCGANARAMIEAL